MVNSDLYLYKVTGDCIRALTDDSDENGGKGKDKKGSSCNRSVDGDLY